MAAQDSRDDQLENASQTSPTQPDVAKEKRSPQKSAKRQKVTRACDSCKSRKRRCNGELPCKSCCMCIRGNGAECTYNASYTRGRIVQPLPSALTVDTSTSKPTQPLLKARSEVADGATSVSRTSRGTSPELEAATLAGQYSGPSSAYSFLRRAWRRFGNVDNAANKAEEPNPAVSIFSYGDKQLPPALSTTGSFILPERYRTAELVSNYFDFAMPTYRFLHQPTLAAWLEELHEQTEANAEHISLIPSRQAVVFIVLATASLFTVDSVTGTLHGGEPSPEAEMFFQTAQSRLETESGKVRLESVQARLAMCLYLLHTSRPNQAWYLFGITVQIIMALGIHRARVGTAPKLDAITLECRKRAFWAAYTLDTYLSVILGRPFLIHSDDVDQQIPEPLDDEEILSEGAATNEVRKDRVIQASIFHAKITVVAKKALKEQYSVHRNHDSHKLSIATKLNAEVAAWRESLPVVLSGQVYPSSLIQIFQRQIVVLELAHHHASILINRPLLLIDSGLDNSAHVNACLSAAMSTLDIVKGYVSDKHRFPSFWYTQYVTFNALAIVYIWLIQRKRGRLLSTKPPQSDEAMYQVAETIQSHLAEATHTNAPSLRYSIILEELQQEANRLMTRDTLSRPPNLAALLETPGEGHPYATPMNQGNSSPSSHRQDPTSLDSISGDFPLDSDLWLHLDSFPFPDIGFEQYGDFT